MLIGWYEEPPPSLPPNLGNGQLTALYYQKYVAEACLALQGAKSLRKWGC